MAISSDEGGDDAANPRSESEQSGEDTPPSKPVKPTTGKLKSVKKTKQAPQPTQASSTQPDTPPKKAKTTRSRKTVKADSDASPKKTRPSKAATTATEQEAQPVARPIYSFFNNATQKQQSSQLIASQRSQSSTPREAAETIDSDDDKGSLAFSKGSSTALAMRKRKVQHQDPESETLPPPATQKFRKTSNGNRTPSFSVVNEDKRSWVEQFAPADLGELAVHKRKVGDVRQWLDSAFNGRRQKILVLKGSAGTGKTTTVNLLAEDMGVTVKEWKNPAGSDYATEVAASSATQFEDFIARAGKVRGLAFGPEADDEEPDEYGPPLAMPDEQLSTSNKQLLLIEEFPNTFSRFSPVLSSFRSALMQYLASPTVDDGTPTPIVLVVSETLLSTNTAAADSFTVHRLLGPELASHPYLDVIEFNAIAPTYLTKALETIVVKEARKSGRRKTPGPAVIMHLAETGDIRSAISSLEFLCLRGDEGDTWSAKVAFTKPKKAKSDPTLTEAEKEALKLITNRESTLGIFHSVGKIIYNKRVDAQADVELPQPPPWLPQHRRTRIPENDVDRLIDELGTDTSTFNAALHENYVLSCSGHSSEETLDSIGGCLDNIADADLLSLDRFSLGTRAFSGSATDTLRQDEMSFQVAARGVLFSLPYPVHRGTPPSGRKSDAHKMFYPTSLKLWRQREEVNDLLELLTTKAQSGALDGTTRLQPKMAQDSGVASWKRQPADAGMSTASSINSTSAKMEMLMERLPYMSTILSSSTSTTSAKSTLHDQIQRVTHISGSAAVDNNEDDDADPKEPDPQRLHAEQWTTDRPDADDDVSASSSRAGGVKRQKGKYHVRQGNGTEGDGLGIPVERSVERLILQDDDIVDD